MRTTEVYVWVVCNTCQVRSLRVRVTAHADYVQQCREVDAELRRLGWSVEVLDDKCPKCSQ